jgi:hypothetical protein
MWGEKHLPALPAAGADGTAPVDLVSHQLAMLEELEKAHIYIDQLHTAVKDLTGSNQEKDQLIADLG